MGREKVGDISQLFPGENTAFWEIRQDAALGSPCKLGSPGSFPAPVPPRCPQSLQEAGAAGRRRCGRGSAGHSCRERGSATGGRGASRESSPHAVCAANAEIKSGQCGDLEARISALGRSHQRPKFPFSIPALIYISLYVALHYPLRYIWHIPALPRFSLALAVTAAIAPALRAAFFLI